MHKSLTISKKNVASVSNVKLEQKDKNDLEAAEKAADKKDGPAEIMVAASDRKESINDS